MPATNAEWLQQLLTVTPKDDPQFRLHFDQHFTELEYRVCRDDVGEQADGFIAYLGQVAAVIPHEDRIYVHILDCLGHSLLQRFESSGEDADLEEAVRICRRAAELTPENHRIRPPRLSNLGANLRSRFERFGELADLEEAIKCYREAVHLKPNIHNQWFYSFLNNLANSLFTRFDCSGDDADLEESITIHRRTIDLMPDGDERLPTALSNLANGLSARFGRFGEEVDLMGAIEIHQDAVTATPEYHRDRALRLHNLGLVLKSSFDRYGATMVLIQAIMYLEAAANITPGHSPELPVYLSSLATSLQASFDHHGSNDDLESAIKNYGRAIELTPEDHSYLPGWLNNLACSLGRRFERSGKSAHLDEAIATYRRAVGLTPDGHKDLPKWLNNFGISLEERFRHLRADADLNEAIQVYQREIKLSFGSTKSIYDCAIGLSTSAHANDLLSLALEGYPTAVSLMSQVAWFGQSVASRQRVLQHQQANFASDAAACAISLGLLAKAVEFLDHGRSIFWSQATNFDTDLTELKETDPDLATKFERLTCALEAGTFHDSTTRPSSGERSKIEIEQRRLLTKELEALLERIRDLPNLHNFMKPPSFSELQLAAAEGPVILLNASSYRCDALVVTNDSPPQLVPLSNMSMNLTSSLAKDFTSNKDDRNFRSYLERTYGALSFSPS